MTNLDPHNLVGKTISYTTTRAKLGKRKVVGQVIEISQVPDQQPWFLIEEQLGEVKSRHKVPVWYALDLIEDWKVL